MKLQSCFCKNMKFSNYYFNHHVINLRFIAIKSTSFKSNRFKKKSQLLCFLQHYLIHQIRHFFRALFGKFCCTVYGYIMQMVSGGVKQIVNAVLFFSFFFFFFFFLVGLVNRRLTTSVTNT